MSSYSLTTFIVCERSLGDAKTCTTLRATANNSRDAIL